MSPLPRKKHDGRRSSLLWKQKAREEGKFLEKDDKCLDPEKELGQKITEKAKEKTGTKVAHTK